ncbi:transcription factor NAI1-like [Sorghum bicolor]|uniref:BHLH domain-containing protein n=1 Tax=Sorghum bicolor TaxID=4558 RepID=A0A1B6PEI3_SORBI|nr:transcription factor NAI1-like [Sorghum bicolor]XP_021301708.1 transcription factor NAI1-like [Sorghum bicolor]KXG24110.1 hypothetical protein SORBI_3008G186100 [Sorghum bicolor]KXG24111.1 hypothetical protein SORBI_3008G186100 [Sorghum bicolor]|eukprot:XP_021301707.1 transcription factor NAI1-like [Sorghum bicolor]
MMDRHMEDSSTFLQWAMNHLQHHQHPATAAAAAAYQQEGGAGVGARISGGAGDQEIQDAAAAFPSLQVLRASQPQTAVPASVRVRDLTVQVGDYGGLTNSSSSGDSPGAGAGAAMDHDAVAAAWSPHTARSRTTGLGGGSNSRPVSWNFSAASALPADDRGAVAVALPDATAAVARVQQRAASASAGRRGGSAGPSAAATSPGPVQDHIIAERRRREKINQRFIELSTVIPGLKKMDKATILGDAVKYVRELQEKVKGLEEDGAAGGSGSIQSAVLVTKQQCHMSEDEAMASSHGGSGGADGGMQLPEIEARLSERSVLLRIHCYSARGLLVRVISEVEQMQLSITHTNVMPFPASTAIITITAKVEEGFNATVDEIVRRINSALRQHYSSSSEETRG